MARYVATSKRGDHRQQAESPLPTVFRHFVATMSNAPGGALPFYCDPDRVGAFAVAPDQLAASDDAA